MDMNDVAKLVTLREGKKVSQPIAQVKETLARLLDLAAEEPGVICVLAAAVNARRKKLNEAPK